MVDKQAEYQSIVFPPKKNAESGKVAIAKVASVFCRARAKLGLAAMMVSK
jgi:hypothetical protein